MTTKTAPLGICDNCGATIPGNRWYTSHGQPRRYCSIECRNTANSHNGEPIRYAKLMARVASGDWQNPAKLNPPTNEEQARRSRIGRQAEVEAGIWRNPALSPEARQKLSRPRKHTGDLASAIDKLRHSHMADLTQEERAAYLEYRKTLRKLKKAPS